MHMLPNRGALVWSMSLAAVLVAGLMTAIWITIGSLELLASAWRVPAPNNEQLVFTLQGEALFSTRVPGNPVAQFRTLDGQHIEKPQEVEINTANSPAIPPLEANPRTFPGWHFRILGFLQPPPPAVQYWYLLQGADPTNLSYFVGYDPETKEIVGYIGRKGYSSGVPAKNEQFTIRGQMYSGVYASAIGAFNQEPSRFEADRPYLFLVADGELLKIDLRNQTVETMPLSDKLVSVGLYEQPTAVDDEDRDAIYQWRVVVRMEHQLQILTMDGHPIRTIPLPRDAENKAVVLLGTTQNEIIVQARPADDHYAPLDLYWVDPEGKVLRHQPAQVRERPAPPGAGEDWTMTAIIPIPLFWILVPAVGAIKAFMYGTASDAMTVSLAELSEQLLPFLALLFITSVLAVYAYRRQRNYSFNSALAWGGFVLLLGPPGLIGYLVHRQWPPRAGCPNCGAFVPRDRSVCANCHEAFPPPAARGIEVVA